MRIFGSVSKNQPGLGSLVASANSSPSPLIILGLRSMALILQRKPGTAQYYTEDLGGVDLDMIAIPGGQFMMGSPDDELDRTDDEGPQHLVTVSPFYMGRYPVTQAQWRFVAGLDQVKQKMDSDPSRFKGKKHPVEKVSWHDATEFCARMTQHTGRLYRLPSEAEWEYACRANTTTPFYFGETINSDLVNYHATEVYGSGTKGKFRQETTPVDQFEFPNAFGLSDMHGNVWEWCSDHWHSNYEGTPGTSTPWIDSDASESTFRVLRGGSWSYNPRDCRSASRYFYVAGDRVINFGFRVVCVVSRS
jgi:formylglycine-generating enzyme required for sulfatase activity